MIVDADDGLGAKDEAVDIIGNIKEAFEGIIDEAQWMDSSERQIFY